VGEAAGGKVCACDKDGLDKAEVKGGEAG